jgi:hypothetical protein
VEFGFLLGLGDELRERMETGAQSRASAAATGDTGPIP